MQYVALLRGINVGGKNKLPMADLRACLENAGLYKVRTYIQSGNVIFESSQSDQSKLVNLIEAAILGNFSFPVLIASYSQPEFESIAKSAPKDWLKNPDFKYNYIFLRRPWHEMAVVEAIGELKPELESITAGNGVLYQAMSIKLFGRTTTGKMASKPIYQQMTIRNHTTVTKLVEMLHATI
ncbi:DUF1697 domain-containing protein [Aeromicrobium sp.]|nr:DUF1697 domain-containing protein [Candidatus Saccharibacteria bacterium]